MLQWWEDRARRHGVPPARMATWIRRKMGGHLVIWRCLCDGSFGCAAPCVLCAKQLAVYDFHIHCPLSASEWWHGRLSEAAAPQAKLTHAQRKTIGAGEFSKCATKAAAYRATELPPPGSRPPTK